MTFLSKTGISQKEIRHLTPIMKESISLCSLLFVLDIYFVQEIDECHLVNFDRDGSYSEFIPLNGDLFIEIKEK